MNKLIATFGVRGVVYILTGKYANAFEERAKFIHDEYWRSKHSAKGYRVKHADRPHRYGNVSKQSLLMENDNLRKEVEEGSKRSNRLSKKIA